MKFLISRAILRSLWQVVAFFAFGAASVMIADHYPTLLGQYFAPIMLVFGFVFLAGAGSRIFFAIWSPHVDDEELLDEAIQNKNTSAALVFLGRCLIVAMLFFIFCSSTKAATLQSAVKPPPPQSLPMLVILKQEQPASWPELTMLSYQAGQFEQETCPSDTSKSCWSADAELLTCREQGVGLGQFTRAFKGDCAIDSHRNVLSSAKVRFDVLADLTSKYPTQLKGLSWQHWNDPRLQIRGALLMNRATCNGVTDTANEFEHLTMCAVAYNGGAGGLRQDRLACRAKAGCNPRVWFGNVENTSLKSKVPMPGYGGQSPFSISRQYPINLWKRAKRYEGVLAPQKQTT